MARRRHRASLKKPASAFAPAQGGSGKTIAWEALAVDLFPISLDNAFPNVAAVAAGRTLRFRTLIPENVTRGTVTLERIRGQTLFWYQDILIDGNGEEQNIVIPANIQLVPLSGGIVALDSVLNPRDSADLESNRIVWRHNYYPNFSDASGVVFSGGRFYDIRPGTEHIDVKSRRRFDRASWALIMAIEYDTVAETSQFAAVDLRALFRTGDGV